MKIISNFRILLICITASFANAQPSAMPIKWDKVHIASDTVRPVWIQFADSLHGYFMGVYIKPSPDPVFHYGTMFKFVLFKTSDGGKSWVDGNNMNYPDKYYLSSASVIGSSNRFRPFAFPTNKDFYITLPHYDTTITTWDGQTIDIASAWIYRSHNQGSDWLLNMTEPWSIGNNGDIQWTFVTALGAKDLLFYKKIDQNRNNLFRSFDGGQSITFSASDDVFARSLHPDTLGRLNEYEAEFMIECSDPFNWTALLINPILLDEKDSAEFYSKFPRGLRTLTTSNSGKKWQEHITALPNDTSIIFQFAGDLQYIKGTPHLYCFSGIGGSAETGLNIFHSGTYYRSSYGINFCYSSDYGKTWKIDTTFGQRRRAYEAVQKDELWFTLPRNETGRDDDPAYILARTTDGGVSYAFDTTTLTHFEQKLDGRIITFSDPRHGWIVATGDNHKDLYILRYDANEQPKGVEDDIFKGYYGIHYTLYPNPANEIARLSMYKYLTLKDVSVYNVFGGEVPLGYRIDGSDVELDVRSLPIGHYTLRVKHNRGISVIPLVVMQ